MRELIENIVFLIFLISFPVLIAGLIKPTWFSRLIPKVNRKKVAAVFGSIFIASFILFGLVADDPINTEVEGESTSPTPTVTITSLPSKSPTPTNKPTTIPTNQTTPTPTMKRSTPTPTYKPATQSVQGSNADNSQPNAQSSVTCDCSLNCDQITCSQAQYLLDVCGCTSKDRDGDGKICEDKCGG